MRIKDILFLYFRSLYQHNLQEINNLNPEEIHQNQIFLTNHRIVHVYLLFYKHIILFKLPHILTGAFISNKIG